jgi:hypothetical protein
MEYYVGLDVSLKQTSICVVDQAGLVVREGVVDSDPEMISIYANVSFWGRPARMGGASLLLETRRRHVRPFPSDGSSRYN